ncbi:hypothetical protein OG458_42540 (plasmid) [Streptomyces sp. NBC_01281]|uniref:hypothetical protein n=1 Tax=Streptomyces sp. NBC_01281 TaxID=2903811 RepID=UPI002E0F4834|nr:hypothetical protein OG458_42540 [Streptomyces sp. NBC_01281]
MARGISSRDFDNFTNAYVEGLKKSLEQAARRNPHRAQIEAASSTSGGVLSSSGAIESSAYLAQLLMWLDANHQQRPAEYVDVTRFVEELQLEDADPTVLALQLEQHGLVSIARSLAGATDVHLTDEGVVTVQWLKNLQKDRAARLRHAMDAFLRWLYDTAGDQRPIDPVLFLVTPGSYFAGAEITGTELHQALSYLAEHNIIAAINTDPATVAITPKGVSCALAGGSVQDHINQPGSGSPVFHIATNNGNIAANSSGFSQTSVTQAGFDPAQILAAVTLVQQLAPALTPDADERQGLLAQVSDLEEAATSSEPEPGVVRRIASGLMSTIRGLAHSPDVQRLALEAVEQGIQNL